MMTETDLDRATSMIAKIDKTVERLDWQFNELNELLDELLEASPDDEQLQNIAHFIRSAWKTMGVSVFSDLLAARQHSNMI